MNQKSNCMVCEKLLRGRQTLYCSMSCKNKIHQSYGAQKARGIKRKLYFVQKLGGQCSSCGYSKNISALAFHHNGDKEFVLDARSLSNRKLEPINNEIAKCKLLCHNCHAEFHNPSLDTAKLLIEPTALTPELQPRIR